MYDQHKPLKLIQFIFFLMKLGLIHLLFGRQLKAQKQRLGIHILTHRSYSICGKSMIPIVLIIIHLSSWANRTSGENDSFQFIHLMRNMWGVTENNINIEFIYEGKNCHVQISEYIFPFVCMKWIQLFYFQWKCPFSFSHEFPHKNIWQMQFIIRIAEITN